MNKLRKLVLTVGALAALAVGGAAFAQAQNAGNAAQVAVQQSMGGDQGGPGDTDKVQSGDQGRPDQGSQAGEREDGEGRRTEAPAHETEAD
jgi:hypothetical protein